jgi:hypothetical protein
MLEAKLDTIRARMEMLRHPEGDQRIADPRCPMREWGVIQ